MYFSATSDALVSKGLAAILIKAYSGLPPEVILKSPPIFLDKIGLENSLSPHRSNGVYQMYLQMKRYSLKQIVKQSTKDT